jgi:hypothetical protein
VSHARFNSTAACDGGSRLQVSSQPQVSPSQPQVSPSQPPASPSQPQVSPSQPQVSPQLAQVSSKSAQVSPKSAQVSPQSAPSQPKSAPSQPKSAPSQPQVSPLQTHATSIGKVSSCQLMRFPSARSAIANSCNLNWQGELLPAHTISICKVSNCQLTPTLSDRLTRITCLYTERGGAQSPKAASASTRGGDGRRVKARRQNCAMRDSKI